MTFPIFHEHRATDAPGLARALAAFVADRLEVALRERGLALLIVSGGSTPIPFLEALSACALDWSRVHVTLADERCVPEDAIESNVGLVRRCLLQGAARHAIVHALPALTEPGVDAAALAEDMLADLPWPADVVVLGMGGDGHTASLFPNAPELAQALDPQGARRCLMVSVPPLPNVPVPRLTLTARALLDTHCIVVHTTGATKRGVLERAIRSDDLHQWPIRLAWQQDEVPCHLFHVD